MATTIIGIDDDAIFAARNEASGPGAKIAST